MDFIDATDSLLTALGRQTDPSVARVERYRNEDAELDLFIVHFDESDGRDPIEIRIKDEEWDPDARVGTQGNVFDVTSERLRTALQDSMTA